MKDLSNECEKTKAIYRSREDQFLKNHWISSKKNKLKPEMRAKEEFEKGK